MNTVSASRIKTYARCPRKWWYQYVVQLPGGSSKAASSGTKCHTVAENYLKHGTPPDTSTLEGHTISHGLEHLPPVGSVVTEHSWRMVFDDVVYTGIIDFHSPTLLGDHKTTSNFQWALTPEQLRADVQWVLYATWMVLSYDQPKMHGRWIYYLRVPPGRRGDSRVVEVEADREELLERFEQIHTKYGLPMARCQAIPERNTKACGDYGGCPFKAECKPRFSLLDLAQ